MKLKNGMESNKKEKNEKEFDVCIDFDDCEYGLNSIYVSEH